MERRVTPARLIPIHWEAFKNASLAAQTAPSAIATVETACSVTQVQDQSTSNANPVLLALSQMGSINAKIAVASATLVTVLKEIV